MKKGTVLTGLIGGALLATSAALLYKKVSRDIAREESSKDSGIKTSFINLIFENNIDEVFKSEPMNDINDELEEEVYEEDLEEEVYEDEAYEEDLEEDLEEEIYQDEEEPKKGGFNIIIE